MSKQIPVWPYFFLALLSGAVGITLLYYNLGSDFPAENSLEKISGRVDRVFLIDDLSGKPTTIIKPINSIHFTLEDKEGVFRYPGNWPGYSKLWYQLSFHVDIWVPRSDIENKTRGWFIESNNRFRKTGWWNHFRLAINRLLLPRAAAGNPRTGRMGTNGRFSRFCGYCLNGTHLEPSTARESWAVMPGFIAASIMWESI